MSDDSPLMVVMDASLFLRVLLPDERTPSVSAMWDELLGADTVVVAPHLFTWECINGILQALRQRRVDVDTAEELLGDLEAAPVEPLAIEHKAAHAWRRFVIPLGMPAVYDAAYLALAAEIGCELWTADRRLYRMVGEALPWVRAVGFEE